MVDTCAPYRSVRARMLTACGLLSLILGGCVSTQEMPLAPNIVRIDTRARGALFTGQTVPTTMRAAALATIARGYTNFRFADATMQQGSVPIGTTSTIKGFGSPGAFSGFATTTVDTAPVAQAAVTVIMFHADEPGAKGTFVAADVLKQYAGS